MNDKKQSPQPLQMVIIPATELDAIRQDLNSLKEVLLKVTPNLGDWMTEIEAQALLERKSTTLWRLRANGTINSKKIGSKNYYSKKSIIEFLNSEK